MPPAAADRASCLESYRVDVTAGAWPILVPAAIITTLGALFLSTAFIAHGPLGHRAELSFAGSLCMLVGPLLAIFGMRALLAEDEWVAVHEDGVLLHCNGANDFVDWSELARVRFDAPTRALVFERRERDPICVTKPFARTTSDRLAAHLDDLRRKAIFHLT